MTRSSRPSARMRALPVNALNTKLPRLRGPMSVDDSHILRSRRKLRHRFAGSSPSQAGGGSRIRTSEFGGNT
eukprot:1555040-Amphidinium_carterae.1